MAPKAAKKDLTVEETDKGLAIIDKLVALGWTSRTYKGQDQLFNIVKAKDQPDKRIRVLVGEDGITLQERVRVAVDAKNPDSREILDWKTVKTGAFDKVSVSSDGITIAD